MDGLGELVAQFDGLTQSDKFFEPYLALAEELDIPVCFHSGFPPPGSAYDGIPKNRAKLGSPFGVEDALVKHPKIRPYIAHGGYPFLEETIAVLHAHPQLYVDISEINWLIPKVEFHEYLRRLIQSGFGKRLMYGSDQMFWPEAIGISIEAIDSAPFLTQEQKKDIFYNNAARFLKLSEEQITKHHEQIKPLTKDKKH
jgi:predicted TIM-barrel fold metal-dependent hydrolase